MSQIKKPKATTGICRSDADSITLRGRDLVTDVIGNYSFTGAFLLQALGGEPSAEQVRLLDAVMVTIMEHGLMPSVIATRLTLTGAPESLQGAVAAGLLGVGDRYGGTAGKCGELAERLLAAEQVNSEASAVVAEHLEAKRPLPASATRCTKGETPVLKSCWQCCLLKVRHDGPWWPLSRL